MQGLSPKSEELKDAVKELKLQLDEMEQQGKELEREAINATNYREKYKIMERENQKLKMKQREKRKQKEKADAASLRRLVKGNMKRATRKSAKGKAQKPSK